MNNHRNMIDLIFKISLWGSLIAGGLAAVLAGLGFYVLYHFVAKVW